jgi:hypothetical protein
VRACHLEGLGIPHVCQHGARDLLLVVVPQDGSHGRLMRGWVLVDLLGAQAVHR